EAGRDERTRGVDLALRGARTADFGDHAVVDGDVGGARVGTGAVEDVATSDDEVVGHAEAPVRRAGSNSVAMSRCDSRATSPPAPKLAPVMTKRLMPSPCSSSSRAAQTSGGPTTANRSTKSDSSPWACAALLRKCTLLS